MMYTYLKDNLDLSVFVHAHPVIEMKIGNLKKDSNGYIAECVLYNKESKKVESSFYIDEDKALEIISLIHKFLSICQK